MVLSILQKGLSRCLFLWWDFYWRVWFREVSLFFWGTFFFPFFCFLVFVSVCLCVAIVINGYNNLSFFSLFSLFLDFSNRCICEVLNSSDSSFSLLFVIHRVCQGPLSNVRPCALLSVVQFKNGTEHCTIGTVHVFIPLMGFLLQSWVSRSFHVLLR